MNVYSMLSACKWEGEGGVCVCVCVCVCEEEEGWGGGAPRLSQWEQSSANVISRRLSSVPELRSAQPWWTSPPTPVSIYDHALTVHRADPGLGSCEVVFCFGCGQPGCLQSRDIAQIKKEKKRKKTEYSRLTDLLLLRGECLRTFTIIAFGVIFFLFFIFFCSSSKCCSHASAHSWEWVCGV